MKTGRITAVLTLSFLALSCNLLPVPTSPENTTPPPGTGGSQYRKVLSCTMAVPTTLVDIRTCYLCRTGPTAAYEQFIVPVVNISGRELPNVSLMYVMFLASDGSRVDSYSQQAVRGGTLKSNALMQGMMFSQEWTLMPGDTGYVFGQAQLAFDAAASVKIGGVGFDSTATIVPFATSMSSGAFQITDTGFSVTINNTSAVSGYTASSWALLRDAGGIPCLWWAVNAGKNAFDPKLFDTIPAGQSATMYGWGANISGVAATSLKAYIYYFDSFTK
jgi:hypothetical protein